MRFGRLLPALSVSVAAGALIVLTGTGAAATQPGRSAPAAITWNLAAPAALDSATRASLVTQRGARNYAGPNCPGKGWNCTTSTRVLQISTNHGQNRVDCSSGATITQEPQSCLIEQTGTNNLAYCYQRTNSSAAAQTCVITQTGRINVAHVNQSVHASNSDTQSATQTAEVNQTSSGSGYQSGNQSSIDQAVKQSTGNSNQVPSELQMQDADQTATVKQTAEGRADNYSHVHQSQWLSARNALTQKQNTLGGPDCVAGFPFSPNACAHIEQSGINGHITSFLKQKIKEDAKTNAVATQQQGSFSGGIDGYVHQDTVSGRSRNHADQHKGQDLDAPSGSSQTQYDPLRCCGTASQIGGSNNAEQVRQSSTQDASDGNAFQMIAILGESFSPEGRCSVSQRASNNSDSATNDASAEPCTPPLVLATVCTSDDGEGACTAQTVEDGCVDPFCDSTIQRVFAKPKG